MVWQVAASIRHHRPRTHHEGETMTAEQEQEPEQEPQAATEGGGSIIAGPRVLSVTSRQLKWAGWSMTLLAYIVVLNLFEEYVGNVVIDSFTISILTSIVLLVLLVIVQRFEHRVHGWFVVREGTVYRVLGPISVLSILFVSKLVILEVVDFIFGEHVELGHFVEVLVLVLLLILAQKAIVFVWKALGEAGSATNKEILEE
jgi:hypothetical protein